MRTLYVTTVIVCLVGLQINGQYYEDLEDFEPQLDDLYAEETRYPSKTFNGYGSNRGGSSKYGYKGGLGGHGKGQNYGVSGASNYRNSYGKGKNYGGSGFGGGFGFGAGGKSQYHGQNKGHGSSYGKSSSGYGIVGSTHEIVGSSYEAPKEYSRRCGVGCVGSSHGGVSYGSAKGYSNGCEGGCGSPFGNKGFSFGGGPNYSDRKGDYRSTESEDVGASHSGTTESSSESPGRSHGLPQAHRSHGHDLPKAHVSHGYDLPQTHISPGPAYTYSYPSPPPHVKCGHNLLISCNPSSQVVPCSAYSPPAHGPAY